MVEGLLGDGDMVKNKRRCGDDDMVKAAFGKSYSAFQSNFKSWTIQKYVFFSQYKLRV